MSIENKLSTLSTIPEKALVQLHTYMDMIASHDIVTQIMEYKDVIELDIFEGKLYIMLDHDTDTIKYKFVPSDAFNKLVKSSIIDKKSFLLEKCSDKLKEVLTNTYKDLI